MAAPEQLPGLLEAWLPGQRWFAGKGRAFSVMAVFAAGILTERPWRSDVWLVRVRYADDGSTDTYQVPLVRRPQPADQVAHVLVGETPDPDYGGLSWWYDALHDKEVTGAWLAGMETSRSDGLLRQLRRDVVRSQQLRLVREGLPDGSDLRRRRVHVRGRSDAVRPCLRRPPHRQCF